MNSFGIKRRPIASRTSLDNTINGFVADNVQDGIEEIDFRQETLEPTGFVNTRYNSVISFDEATRIFSISPVSGSYVYFIRGIEYDKTGPDTVTIGNINGPWFIYFSGNTLTASQTKWEFTTATAFVAFIYWSVLDQKAIILNEERHGIVMDWATHRHEHITEGMDIERYKFDPENYIIRGDGSLNAHAQIGYGNLGQAFDEDLDFLPVNSATPVNDYEQTISPYLYAPVLYRDGAAATWRKLPVTAYPFAWQADNLSRYNQWTGYAWQLTTCTNNYFFNSYLCLAGDSRHPFVSVLGGGQYSTVVDAAGELFKSLVPYLPSPEIYPLVKCVWKTSSSYTNQSKTVLFALLPIGEAVIDNDRYAIEMGEEGDVGVGKYLERATGAGSNDNPFIFPEASFIRYISVQSKSGTTPTVTVGLFKITDLVHPIITISLVDQNFNIVSFSQYFLSGDQIAFRIISGSINKPLLTMWIQTQLG